MIMFNMKSNLVAVRNSEEGTGVTEALRGPRTKHSLDHVDFILNKTHKTDG